MLLLPFCASMGTAAAQSTVPAAVRDAIAETLGSFESEASGGVAVRLNKPDGIYREGETIAFEVIPPARPVHLYLDYYQIDGNVVHLLPAPGEEPPRHDSGRPIRLGQADSELSFEILPPFGQEMIVAVAAPRPLVPPRQEFEDALVYQEALRSGIAELRGRGDADEISVWIRPIATYAENAEIPSPAQVATLPDAAPEPAPAEATLAPAPAEEKVEPAPPEDESLPDAALPVVSPPPEPPANPRAEQVPADEAEAPATDNGASEPKQTAALTAPDTTADDAAFKARIRNYLNRLREAPGDEQNLTALISTYQEYAGHLIERGEYAIAKRQLEMAFALDPLDDRTAALARRVDNRVAVNQALEAAQGYLASEEYDRAYESLARILELEPDHPMASAKLPEIRDDAVEQLHRRAMTAFRREDLDEAIATWDRLLAIEPEHQRGTMYRGLALDLKSRLKELESQQQ